MPKRPPSKRALQALANAPMTTPTLGPWLLPPDRECPWCGQFDQLDFTGCDGVGNTVAICEDCWINADYGPE
ncbi:MAG: hypothetical protein MUE77_12095 [Sandarakinorhabdus sp.]|nr:hypothetical protein [Sandarakinorhabdus sp.]